MTITRRNFVRLSTLAMVSLPITRSLSAPLYPRRIKLVLHPEQRNWFPETEIPIDLWGFDHDVLRLRRGETVEIEVENRLTSPSSVHWHGLRIDNQMDGVSGMTQAPILPGERFIYRFTPEDAGTYWAHSHHQSYEQLAKGLYMPLIVEENEPVDVDQDILMAIDDWRVNQQRQLDTNSIGSLHDWSHGGRMGNVFTVNKLIQPAFDVVAGSRVRLRLINTANARIFSILPPTFPAWISAKDGQPLPSPIEHSGQFFIGPAERYDFVLDIPEDAEGTYAFQMPGNPSPLDLAYLRILGSQPKRGDSPPKPFPANALTRFNDTDVTQSIRLEMTGGAMGSLRQAMYQGRLMELNELIQNRQIWAFNGTASRPDEPLLEAKTGDVVEIELINNSRWPHSMHLHGHHFKANSPHYDSSMWHDTLLIAGGESVKIQFQAGKPGSWLLHCHMIEHQAAGMVSWIRVVA